jgi:hypothetical protein
MRTLIGMLLGPQCTYRRFDDELGLRTGQIALRPEQGHCGLTYDHDPDSPVVGRLVHLQRTDAGTYAVFNVGDRFELDERCFLSVEFRTADHAVEMTGSHIRCEDVLIRGVSLVAAAGAVEITGCQLTPLDVTLDKGGYDTRLSWAHRQVLDRCHDHLRRSRTPWVEVLEVAPPAPAPVRSLFDDVPGSTRRPAELAPTGPVYRRIPPDFLPPTGPVFRRINCGRVTSVGGKRVS